MRFWGGLLVSILFLYLFLQLFQPAQAFEQVKAASPAWLLAALLVLVFDFSIRVLRWALLLRQFNPDIRTAQAAGPFLASFALNNVMPLRAGDIARAFAFSRQLGADSSQVTATLVIERVLDLGALLLLLAVGLSVVPAGTELGRAGYAAIALVFLLLASAVAWPGLWRRLAAVLPFQESFLMRFGYEVLNAIETMRGLGRWLALIALSALAWLLEGTVFLCVALALFDLNSWVAPWFALALGSLATLLPSSPGYIGTFDYFSSLGFSLSGTSREIAGATALLIHLILWLPITVAGFGWMLALWGQDLRGKLQQLQKRP